MGQLARNSERNIAGRAPIKLTPRPPRESAAYEWKYFVLALAALIGLGVGWLSGEAVTGWLPDKDPPLAVAERATTVTLGAPGGLAQAAQSPASDEAAASQDTNPDATAPMDSGAPADWTAQATADDQARAWRKAARHAHARRQGRGNFFSRALRRLRIW